MSLILFPTLWSARRHWPTGGWGPGRTTCSLNTAGQTRSRLAAQVQSTALATLGHVAREVQHPTRGGAVQTLFPGDKAQSSRPGAALESRVWMEDCCC